MPLPQSAVNFLARQRERLKAACVRPRIVFAEGDDPRVAAAAAQLASEGLLDTILIGPGGRQAGVRCIEPTSSPLLERYARIFWERMRSRGLSEMEARQQAGQRLQFAALMVAAGDAEAAVAGAVHTSGEWVRATLQAIELREGRRRLSSAHIMAVQNPAYGHHGLLAFSDAALIIEPNAAELAEIAISAAETARILLEAEPLVALLSFSTKGSAQHREVEKVIEALRYVRARAPELLVDGELQADAALEPAVARSKAPGSLVAGRANTLVFPDLNSANIGYKLVERLAEGALLAVVLQGLSRPVSMVWRGCSVEDLAHAALVAGVQAVGLKQAGG